MFIHVSVSFFDMLPDVTDMQDLRTAMSVNELSKEIDIASFSSAGVYITMLPSASGSPAVSSGAVNFYTLS